MPSCGITEVWILDFRFRVNVGCLLAALSTSLSGFKASSGFFGLDLEGIGASSSHNLVLLGVRQDMDSK